MFGRTTFRTRTIFDLSDDRKKGNSGRGSASIRVTWSNNRFSVSDKFVIIVKGSINGSLTIELDVENAKRGEVRTVTDRLNSGITCTIKCRIRGEELHVEVLATRV